MQTWLLTWNPKLQLNNYLHRIVAKIQSRHPRVEEDNWSCGVNKSIRAGDRLFLIKLGIEPKGIVASGVATSSEPYFDRAWKGKPNRKRSLYVDVIWDSLLSLEQVPLTIRKLPRGMHWEPQASGVTISAAVAAQLERLWKSHYRQVTGRKQVGVDNFAAELPSVDETLLPEGQVTRHMVTHRKRESRNRLAKLTEARRNGRVQCEVPRCGFDFEAVYGEIGIGFAEVHHKKPLHRSGKVLTKLSDLAVVCANCHRMIHRDGKCRSLSTLIKPRRR